MRSVSRARRRGAGRCQRFTLHAALRAVGLFVVEMSGRAGDVHLMDMRLLHSPSINASKQPRVMATTRYMTG